MRSLNKTLETEVKSALRRGGNDTLNIYFMDATPYLGAPLPRAKLDGQRLL